MKAILTYHLVCTICKSLGVIKWWHSNYIVSFISCIFSVKRNFSSMIGLLGGIIHIYLNQNKHLMLALYLPLFKPVSWFTGILKWIFLPFFLLPFLLYIHPWTQRFELFRYASFHCIYARSDFLMFGQQEPLLVCS